MTAVPVSSPASEAVLSETVTQTVGPGQRARTAPEVELAPVGAGLGWAVTWLVAGRLLRGPGPGRCAERGGQDAGGG